MGSLALNPDNVIKLWTRNGDCEIQLLYGDITKLPLEEKMDILMVSAFPGTIPVFVHILSDSVVFKNDVLFTICKQIISRGQFEPVHEKTNNLGL